MPPCVIYLQIQESWPGLVLAFFGGMGEKAEQLKLRTHRFFVRVIALCEALPSRPAPREIAGQLAASAGATDSNYRATCRARSKREFIAKIGIAAEEAEESFGWLLALRDANLGDREEVLTLLKEADELTRIFIASKITAEQRLAEQERLEGKGSRRRQQSRR